MARLSVASENTALSSVFVPGTTYYLSLHSGDPAQNGANEISGGSYARQAIVFTSASAGSESNTASITFTSLPAAAGGLGYFGVWTASTSGTYLGGGTTTGLTGSLPSGISINFATGAVTLSIS